MKETSNKSKYFLIISASFWILILATYLSFSTLDDLDIVSFYACIENIDQEDSIPSSEKKEIICNSLAKLSVSQNYLKNCWRSQNRYAI